MPKSAVKNTGSSSSLVDAGAGFVGATAMVLSTQPIDTLKVNYQCNTTKSPKSWSSILAHMLFVDQRKTVKEIVLSLF